MATSDASTLDSTTDDFGASTTIGESTDGSTATTLTYFTSTSTTYSTTERWRTTTTTRGSITYPSPTNPSTTTTSTLIIIVAIVLSLALIFGIIYYVFQNRRAKQQRARNLNNAVLMANNNNNNNLRFAPPIYPQGMRPASTSVTVNDQLPDYDAVMMEPSAPARTLPPQLIIRSFTQEDDSPPPNYVTPDVIADSNAIPFILPLPPSYEEATSQPNSRRNSFSETTLTL